MGFAQTQSGGIPKVTSSYATGKVMGTAQVGGLVGSNQGEVIAAYADVAVTGNGTNNGGLVGHSAGPITASYALGKVNDVQGSNNGLVGGGNGTITDSYYLLDGFPNDRAAKIDPGQRYSELMGVTSYVWIYEDWNVSVDGDGTPDDLWDFRNSQQFPALKADRNGDGTRTWQEFGAQDRAPKATYLTVNLSVSPNTLAEDAGETTVTATATATSVGAPAPERGINLSVWIHRKDQTFTSVFAGADDFTATDIPDINIPAGEHSAPVTFTLTPVNDGDYTEDVEQIVIKGFTVISYGKVGHITRAVARMYLTNPYVPPPSAYTPRMPQPTVSLNPAGSTVKTTRAVSRPGRFDLYVIPDPQTVRDKEEFGESQAYKDYHGSLRYLWKQVAGPPTPANGVGLPGNSHCASGGPGTYCTYTLSHPDQAMSFDVWDGVTRPTEWQSFESYDVNGVPSGTRRDLKTPANPATPPGIHLRVHRQRPVQQSHLHRPADNHRHRGGRNRGGQRADGDRQGDDDIAASSRDLHHNRPREGPRRRVPHG